MKIAVASGKGGTGKTTVSVNLFHFMEKYFDRHVMLVDCDVEEPNDLLFFAEPIKTNERQTYLLIPQIDINKCTFCKKCSDWCEFNAITIVKNLNFAKVNPDLCHSCGACSVACTFDAITEHEQPLGVVSHYATGIGNGLVEGRLKIGSAMQTSLIKEVKKEVQHHESLIIFDSPPGTSCPVVETVVDADYVILVTEPTPFGVHDLKITVELLNDLNKPFGIIVNKAGLGSNDIYDYIHQNSMDLLGKIPFSRAYASQYSTGDLLRNIPPEMEEIYKEIVAKLKTRLA